MFTFMSEIHANNSTFLYFSIVLLYDMIRHLQNESDFYLDFICYGYYINFDHDTKSWQNAYFVLEFLIIFLPL